MKVTAWLFPHFLMSATLESHNHHATVRKRKKGTAKHWHVVHHGMGAPYVSTPSWCLGPGPDRYISIMHSVATVLWIDVFESVIKSIPLDGWHFPYRWKGNTSTACIFTYQGIGSVNTVILKRFFGTSWIFFDLSKAWYNSFGTVP